MRILYYVSGHGFGHARRSAQVIRAGLDRSPETEFTVRTAAPAELFAPLPTTCVEPSDVDAGMAERGPLAIDADGTRARLIDLLRRSPDILREELSAVRRIRPDLIVADIPFLAGDIAELAGVPCVGISNFSWDWICDPLLAAAPGYPEIRDRIRTGYAKMAVILKLPLGEVSDAFPRRIEVPLIAGQSGRKPASILNQLKVEPSEAMPRVLIAMRGGVPVATLARAASDAPGIRFLLPGSPPSLALPANVTAIPSAEALDFSDLISVSDIVLSKLGYGIVSDCIAGGKALLWPRRIGFREDEIAEREGPKYLRMRELEIEDFLSGDWLEAIEALLASPAPRVTMRTDGAERCAEALLSWSSRHSSSE